MDSAVRRYAEVGSRKTPAWIGKRESSSSQTVPGRGLTVGGISLIGEPGEVPVENDDPFALPEWTTRSGLETDGDDITASDLLLGSAFHLSAGGSEGNGPAFTAWGRVARSGFETEVDDVTMDGDVTSGLIGFDAEWERVLAGVMVSQSSGEGSYRLSEESGGGIAGPAGRIVARQGVAEIVERRAAGDLRFQERRQCLAEIDEDPCVVCAGRYAESAPVAAGKLPVQPCGREQAAAWPAARTSASAAASAGPPRRHRAIAR